MQIWATCLLLVRREIKAILNFGLDFKGIEKVLNRMTLLLTLAVLSNNPLWMHLQHGRNWEWNEK